MIIGYFEWILLFLDHFYLTENIVKELEKFLSSITEIKGYLKIVRSYPLLSLGFLKKLRIIHGSRAKISK